MNRYFGTCKPANGLAKGSSFVKKQNSEKRWASNRVKAQTKLLSGWPFSPDKNLLNISQLLLIV